MTEKTEMQKAGAETMRFMRGKYALDEIGDGNNKLEFRDGSETVLTIFIYEDRYDFLIGETRAPVYELKTLEAAKELILKKKKPNRKPFSKERALYGDCGHRCDLCVHFTGETVSAEHREKMREHVRRVYGMGPDEKFPPCGGCLSGGIDGKGDCAQKKCAEKKGAGRCVECPEYDCGEASVGLRPEIKAQSMSAEDVTWAILPYVDGQYGN